MTLLLGAAEVEDLHERIRTLEAAYAALRANLPVSECGAMVVQRAAEMGVPPAARIRSFMAKQIASFTPVFRARPCVSPQSGAVVLA